MLKEILKVVAYGNGKIDPRLSLDTEPGIICYITTFPLGRVVGLTCIGLSWGCFLGELMHRTREVDLENEEEKIDLMTEMTWRSTFHLKVPFLSQWLATDQKLLNFLSENLDNFPFIPYPFITMGDHLLGQCEWHYRQVDNPSQAIHVSYISEFWENSLEFQLFRKAIRVCGRFSIRQLKRMFYHCKVQELEKGELLLGVGDMDDKMLVVIRGEIAISAVNSKTGVAELLRVAKQGDKLLSLLSLIDALTGHTQPIKTIEVFAKSPSRVLTFPLLLLRNFLILHDNKIVNVVRGLIRKIHDIHYLLLNKSLGIVDDLTPEHSRIDASSKYMKLLPLNPYDLPDPTSEGGGISNELREIALRDLMKFLAIPDDLLYEEILECARVVIVDPDPRGIDVKMPEEYPLLNDKKYKFKYLYKGKADIYTIQESVIYHLQHPNKEDLAIELDEEDIIQEWERDYRKFDHEHFAYMNSGEGIGGLAAFSEQVNRLFIKVIQRSLFVLIPDFLFDTVIQHYPNACFPILHQIILRIVPTMRMMDFGIEWAHVPGGVELFGAGQAVDDTYLVLAGKLRSYTVNATGQLLFHGDYERSSWIGLVEALVMFPFRSKTVVAARASEVVRIPMFYINLLNRKFPNAGAALLQNVAGRSEGRRHASNARSQCSHKRQKGQFNFGKTKYEYFEGNSREIGSICLLPLTDTVPVIPFALEIEKHHQETGNTLILTWESCRSGLKIAFINDFNEFSVRNWITNAMNDYSLVLFVCCNESKRWTRLCVQYAELLIGLGVRTCPAYRLHWMEKVMVTEGFGHAQKKEIVILHSEYPDRRTDSLSSKGIRCYLPYDTSAWLEIRPWISYHHHLRLPQEAFKGEFLDQALLYNVREQYSALKRDINELSDMSRFNRWITGRATGVVFTGGGARVATQIGVLKRFIAEGVAVDMVGGVGTGLVIACLFAMYQDIEAVESAARDIFKTLHSMTHKTEWKSYLFDATVPWISPIQGKLMTEMCEKYFGLARIEDTWIPLFGVTTDVGKSETSVHRNGPMWIYARASFSNFLFAPPVNDTRDGSFMVDGSFSNPIPVDIMRNFGAEFILVLNTTIGVTFEKQQFDLARDIIMNAWRFLFLLASKLSFFAPDFIGINDMITRTQKIMYAEAVQASTDGLYVTIIRPKNEFHPTHSYVEFDKLVCNGLDYANQILRQMGEKTISPNGYRQFWLRLNYINRAMETMEGRALQEDFRDEYFEALDSRMFERDDKLKEMVRPEEYVGAFEDVQKGIVASPILIEAREVALKKHNALKDFTDWLYTKIMK